LNDTFHVLRELINLAMITSSTKEPMPSNLFGSSNSKASRVQEAIDYFYNIIYEKNTGVTKPIFCEDFFYYDKY
jgi:hypothetical protein